MPDDPPKTPLPIDDSTQPVTPSGTSANPAWASDLRQLYNSVVEEPLPDSFKALLSQLDKQD